MMGGTISSSIIKFCEFCGILWNFVEFCGILWNFVDVWRGDGGVAWRGVAVF
jgi:hypothetical protein